MENIKREQGVRAVKFRVARGWTQEDVAHRAGVSTATVSRFELGKHEGRPDTVRKLAKAFEIEESALRGLIPAPLGPDDQGSDVIIGLRDRIDAIASAAEKLLEAQEVMAQMAREDRELLLEVAQAVLPGKQAR